MKQMNMLVVKEAVGLYLRYHRANNSSCKTLTNYQYRFKPLLDAFGNRPVNSLAKWELVDLVASLYERDYKQTTVNCHVQAFKALLNWLYDNEYTERCMSGYISRKRAKDIERKDMSLEDFEKMREACQHFRNYAILTFQADTAARAGEVLTLTLDNLDLDSLTAVVHGKTGKRIVHYTTETRDVLKEYITYHRHATHHSYVFTNLRDPHDPLTNAHSLFQIYKNIAERAGVTGKWNPHSIRHMVAKHFIRNVNMEAARLKLGHDYVQTTQLYANSDDSYTADVSAQFSVLKGVPEKRN